MYRYNRWECLQEWDTPYIPCQHSSIIFHSIRTHTPAQVTCLTNRSMYTLIRTGNRIYLIRADACTQPFGQLRRGERQQLSSPTQTRVSVHMRSELEQIACGSLAPLAFINFSSLQHNPQSDLLINAFNCSPSLCLNLLTLDRFQNSALLLEHFPRAGNTSADNGVMPCDPFAIRGIGTSRLASLIYCFIVDKIDASAD